MALRVSRSGRKQLLIDRINDTIEQYGPIDEELESYEAGAEGGEQGSVRQSQNDALLGDDTRDNRLMRDMLGLLGKPREQQLAELEEWTVRDMRAALMRQGIHPGANSRANMTSKIMVLLDDQKVDADMESSLTTLPPAQPPPPDQKNTEHETQETVLQQQLNSRTMVELKDMLRQRGQFVKGTKPELIERLEPLLLREAAVAEFLSRQGADSVQAELEARGLPTGMDEAESRAALFEALLSEEEEPAALTSAEEEELAAERERMKEEEALERWARFLGPYMRVGVICGGTGPGREASLHSARTLLDQLDTIHHLEFAAYDGAEMDPEQFGINVVPYYIDASLRPHVLSVEQLHAHSAADLDFLLAHTDQAIPSLEEVAEQLKEVADVVVPMVTGDWADGGQLQALLHKAGVHFVGSPSDALALASSRPRLAGEMQRLGFPTLPQLELTAADFPGSDGDVAQLADEWNSVLDVEKAQEEQRLLEQLSPPRDGPVYHNPFGRAPAAAEPAGAEESRSEPEASTSGQSGSGSQQGGVIDVQAEAAALGQPWGRRLWEWVRAAGADPQGGFYVAKPGRVGRGDRPGANVMMSRGLPNAAMAARNLMAQGHESVVVERHMGGAVRVSVAVVEGDQGPIALLPSQEEVVCPEATFLDAGLKAEREAARREGYSEAQIEAVMAGQREALLQDTHGLSYARCLEEDFLDTRLRHFSPPRLPKELVWGLRLAAARLFKELGLRDAAVIDGWVALPERPAAPAAAELSPEERAPPLALPSLQHRLYPRTKGELTAADLEKAARVHEDQDPSFDLQGEYLSDGTEGYKRIFDEAEAKLIWREMLLNKPPPEVDDPSELPPESLCSWDSGTIMFDAVHAALDLAPAGRLFAQAAEAGLSHQAALRHVVSTAARRAGLPAIPTPFAEPMHRTIFFTLPPPRDWDAELDAQLEKDQIFTEEGLFNEALVERPAFDEPPKPKMGAPPDPNAPFVPIWAHPKYGDRVDEGLVRQVEESLKAQGEAAGSGREEDEEKIVAPQRVWILTGGDSSERQASLASGLAAWLRLRTQSDAQVELFLLAPRNAGADLGERQATLLKRRSDLLTMVGIEENLPEELQVQNIRRPQLRPTEPQAQSVWAVPYAAALQPTPEDIHEVCERALRVANTVEHMMAEEDVAAAEVRRYVAQQLVTAEVHGVAGTWGGDPNELAPPPRFMDLEMFAMEAEAASAVVLLALHGGPGENGTVQALLQGYGVPFTGPAWDAASIAIDKAATAEVLAELEVHNISTAPKFPVALPQLLAAADDEEECLALFEDMRDAVGGSDSLVIKPADEGGPAAVARLSGHTDLGWYARAVADRAAHIPAGLLAQPLSRQTADADIPMPLNPPSRFVVEPFVDAESVRMVTGEDGRPEVEWAGDSRWLHVTIGLLGKAGAMRALGPTLKLPNQSGVGTVRVTPPPASLVREDVLSGVLQRAEMVADVLGLNGAASLEALMHAESADLVLMEANAIPDISPSSDLYQQAILDEELGRPTPAELLKELVNCCTFHDDPAAPPGDDLEEALADDEDNNWQYGAMASLDDEFQGEESSMSMASADQ